MHYDYDVAIVGSGIAGGMMAAILAKEGLRVGIFDAGTHPRFAIGESMIPESGLHLAIMAERFGIPELAYPGDIAAINKHIGSSAAGIKLSFSFAWNGHGREHNPADLVSTPVLAPEAHLFRQDIDAYYVALAARLGATIRQQVRISSIAIDDDGATLALNETETVRARYVVDASGYRSPVADGLGLREGAPPLQSRTRSIFTHMVGVKGYEDAIADTDETGSPTAIGQSTLHHMFDKGWLWIIPFDNHPHSTNPLCSVGLQFDIDRHGPAGDPETEFQNFLDTHPSVARQFAGAARVREWTVAPRINYNCREPVGDRFCLLGHASGAIDPLFSRGLANTFESINRLAPKILTAASQDRWRKQDVASYERYSLAVVATTDRLVANSYTAFQSFALWNAWFRVWLSGSYIGVLRLRRVLHDFRRTGDAAALDRCYDEATFPGALSIESAAYERLFDDACTAMEAHHDGLAGEAETVARLHDLFAAARAHLPVDFSRFENRFVSRPTPDFAASLLAWANAAPDGLDAKLARPAGGGFDFLDSYRFGDRLAMSHAADLALAELGSRPDTAARSVEYVDS